MIWVVSVDYCTALTVTTAAKGTNNGTDTKDENMLKLQSASLLPTPCFALAQSPTVAFY